MTVRSEGFVDERSMLQGHLDANRADIVRKASGIPWDLATRRLGPTPTSIAGIVQHLVDVERWWFRHYLLGEDGVALHSTDDDPDGDFDLADDVTMQSLLADYDVACEESRAIAARHELTDECVRARRDGTHPTLRWVYVHMIEELSRHLGHLDIYRELLDGQTDRD
ncbi:MAG: DinB family protein [Actinomycetota bacterium]|nr:DinB family protein [Actinomycetota bacterium]